MRTVVVAAASLEADGPAVVAVDRDLSIAVFREGDALYALESRCPHRGASLDDAEVADGVLTCPVHHFRFRLATGRCFMPMHLRLRMFEVRRDGDRLLIEVPEPPSAGDARPG